MIEIKNVTQKFGDKTIFDNINVQINSGERVAIFGENGVGKTTFVKLLLGFIFPTEGSIQWDETKTYDKKFSLKDVGYVSSTEIFTNNISVKSFISLVRNIYKEFNFNIDKIASIFNFDLNDKRKIKTLSTGQLQRLNICLCFCIERQYYFLDEPTNGLDPFIKKKFLKYLNDMQNKTILYLTHNIEEIENLCDRALFIKNNQIFDTKIDNNNFKIWKEEMLKEYE